MSKLIVVYRTDDLVILAEIYQPELVIKGDHSLTEESVLFQVSRGAWRKEDKEMGGWNRMESSPSPSKALV